MVAAGFSFVFVFCPRAVVNAARDYPVRFGGFRHGAWIDCRFIDCPLNSLSVSIGIHCLSMACFVHLISVFSIGCHCIPSSECIGFQATTEWHHALSFGNCSRSQTLETRMHCHRVSPRTPVCSPWSALHGDQCAFGGFGQDSGLFGLFDFYSTSLVPCTVHFVRMHAQAMDCPMMFRAMSLTLSCQLISCMTSSFMHASSFHALSMELIYAQACSSVHLIRCHACVRLPLQSHGMPLLNNAEQCTGCQAQCTD